jgi:hypothetical protein
MTNGRDLCLMWLAGLLLGAFGLAASIAAIFLPFFIVYGAFRRCVICSGTGCHGVAELH